MAQLQLYITESHYGYSGLLSINPTAAVQSYIRDLRSDLSNVDYDQRVPNLFYMLRQIPEGLLFSIIRTMEGRGTDHRVATLLMPDGIEMTPFEREIVLRVAMEALMLEDFSADSTAKVRSALAHDYKVRHDAPRRIPSHGKSAACAYYGTGYPSLQDYLDSPMYQPLFAEFSGVLLLDAAKGRTISLPDITDKALRPLTALNPPGPTPEGFNPYLFQERFDAPFLVTVGDEITVAWRASGFETLEVYLTPEGPDTPIPVPDTTKARKLISPSSFNIAIEGIQRGSTRFTIIVNGKPIEGPTPFTYAELTAADVEVAAVGFFTYRGIMNLARTSKAMISLKAKGHTYRFELPLDTPEPMESIRIYLRTKRPLEQSPIEGYTVVGDAVEEGPDKANNLLYAPGRKRAVVTAGIIAALAGLLIGYVLGFVYPPSLPDKAEVVPDTVAPVVEAPPVRTMATMVDGPVPPPPADSTDTVPVRRLRPTYNQADREEALMPDPVDLQVPESDYIINPEQ